jgi:tetratricopeptide (TPR) repeat protein
MTSLVFLCNKIIEYSFYALFFLVPLIFSHLTYELFEFNKMLLVYFISIIIAGAWLIKSLETETFYLKRTFLDIPILLFLIANILSTIFSIDPYTSLWGYYTRFNGGLISTIFYIFLYYAFVSNIKPSKVLKMIYVSVISAAVVSFWGALAFFGRDPSCLLINGDFGTSCWNKLFNPTVRAFSTIGQFNWLAAFIAMILPISVSLMIISQPFYKKIRYLSVSSLMYLTFTLAYSRGATIGLAAGLLVFFLLAGLDKVRKYWKGLIASGTVGSAASYFIFTSVFLKNSFDWVWLSALLIIGAVGGLFIFVFFNALSVLKGNRKWLIVLAIAFLIINVLASNAFSHRPVKVSNVTTESVGTGGETDSGQNRLVVWKGALDIAKNFPILGSGVETFAYSYYQFRPEEHNLAGSEWDVLFNKAHNEYLNYLSTTGIVGVITYLALIIMFYIATIKLFLKESSGSNKLIIAAFLSGYTSYLVQNTFSFSVVPIALLFYLFPALIINLSGNKKDQNNPQLQINIKLLPGSIRALYRRRVFQVTIAVIIVYALLKIVNIWQADVSYAKGVRQGDYLSLERAVNLNPAEPTYRIGLSYLLAVMANKEEDPQKKKELVLRTVNEGENAVKASPHNVSLWRNLVRTYYELSQIDSSFLNNALEAALKAVSLAPTDARTHLTLGLAYKEANLLNEAAQTFQKTIELKADFAEAYYHLALTYQQQEEKEKAVKVLEKFLNLFPGQKESVNKLIEEIKGSK